MLYVAEIGLNYDGDIDLAYELIRRAKLSGADVAKFQFGWRDEPGDVNCINEEIARKFKEYCDYHQVEMMVSPINEEGFELAKPLNLNRYKIASRVVVENPKLCKAIMAENKETFVSLGFWEGKELPFGKPTDKMKYVYCKSKYPTYPEQLKDMPKEYSESGYYGHSDHAHGISACLLAISRGAQFIEKHFTINKTLKATRDHIGSASPEEFEQMVKMGNEMSKLVSAIKE